MGSKVTAFDDLRAEGEIIGVLCDLICPEEQEGSSQRASVQSEVVHPLSHHAPCLHHYLRHFHKHMVR